MVLVSIKLVQAAGNLSRRRVCPVGAVSNTMWSKTPVASWSARSLVNSLKAAISTVQAPESCSSMLVMEASGRTLR